MASSSDSNVTKPYLCQRCNLSYLSRDCKTHLPLGETCPVGNDFTVPHVPKLREKILHLQFCHLAAREERGRTPIRHMHKGIWHSLERASRCREVRRQRRDLEFQLPPEVSHLATLRILPTCAKDKKTHTGTCAPNHNVSSCGA